MSRHRDVVFIKPGPVDIKVQAEDKSVNQQSPEHRSLLVGDRCPWWHWSSLPVP